MSYQNPIQNDPVEFYDPKKHNIVGGDNPNLFGVASPLDRSVRDKQGNIIKKADVIITNLKIETYINGVKKGE